MERLSVCENKYLNNSSETELVGEAMVEKTDIVFVSSEDIVPYGTTLMRCLQPKEYLKKMGFSVCVENVYDYHPNGESLIVLHRVVANKYIFSLLKVARSLGSVIIYDTDDLIFDKSGADYLFSIGQKKHAKNFLKVRSLMAECDAISVSTTPLVAYCKDIGPEIYLNKNALSYSFYSRAITNSHHSKSTDKIVIGYLSGSKTHDKDFRVVESTIIKVLTDFPNAIFMSVGPVSVSGQLKRFSGRVFQKKFVPYFDFDKVLNQIDINLVPLEVDEPFCQSKSELKFIEAGIHSIPSVASATVPHVEVIKNGFNGYLANNADDWYRGISLLMDSRHRFEVGRRAKETTMRYYSPEYRAEGWSDFLQKVTSKHSPVKVNQTLLLSIQFHAFRLSYLTYSILKSAEKRIRHKFKSKKS